MSFWMKSLFIGLVAILILTPFIFYFSIFGPNSEYNLSHSDQTWANFGGFIGGTVGPITSCLAFIAVWKTYSLQKKQLATQKIQFKLDELQRFMSERTQQIEKILSSQKDLKIESYNSETQDLFKGTLVSIINENTNKRKQLGNNTEVSEVYRLLRKNFSYEFSALERNINSLCICFDQFTQLGGDSEIIKLHVLITGIKSEDIKIFNVKFNCKEYEKYFKEI
ncbi:MAG: hypothetical protein ACRC2Y_07280 [Aeromonas veronii]